MGLMNGLNSISGDLPSQTLHHSPRFTAWSFFIGMAQSRPSLSIGGDGHTQAVPIQPPTVIDLSGHDDHH
jgi:hypothetical protein